MKRDKTFRKITEKSKIVEPEKPEKNTKEAEGNAKGGMNKILDISHIKKLTDDLFDS